MELARLIETLSRPAAYPGRVDEVEVRQTHISVVFLTPEHVYKIKKPVKLGFLDFSTLERRRHFCDEEVRLNARLAAEVYLGVVPIVEDGGQLKFEAPGEAVEYAVKMQRLPDDATLESRLESGRVPSELIQRVALRIAAFHARAEASQQIASFGRFDVVASNARQNFELARQHVGRAISDEVLERLVQLNEQRLAELHDLIESRARRGVPRDTHGDLRLDHVYVIDEQGEQRMLIVDCIEFNEQLRYADPVSDIAFLAMDLKFEGATGLADELTGAYFQACGDREGRQLLSFYTAYRAAVRGKVEAIKQAEAEVSPSDRRRALQLSRGYWLLALGELEVPQRRPGLILIGGLPGSGKSTLAASLAGQCGCELIRSDVVRKELAGVAADVRSSPSFGQGLYTAEWNDRTYAQCLRRAEELLFAGRRVIVDASFREDERRLAFVDAARRRHVPVRLLFCEAAAETIRQRLASRQGDASDADWAVYTQAARAWQPPSEPVKNISHAIDTAGTREQALDSARGVLKSAGLLSS